MAVPPGAERPGEAGGRPYGEEAQVERRERLVAVAERRERRRRLLHLLLAQAKSGTKPLSPCCSLVTDGRVRVDAGARDHGGGSDDSAYKEAGLRFLFYPMCACARDGCVGFGIHGDGSSCRAPPFFSPEAVWGV